jgi:hypothetical protein
MTPYKPLLLRLTPAEHEALRLAAQRDGRSMAQYAKRALLAALGTAPPLRPVPDASALPGASSEAETPSQQPEPLSNPSTRSIG